MTAEPQPSESMSTPVDGREPIGTLELTREQVERWARRIADKGDALPSGLSAASHAELVLAVRVLLRQRLVGFVASAIARRLTATDENRGPEH